MASLAEQINTLTLRLDGLQTLVNGGRSQGLLYAAFGQFVRYGCFPHNTANVIDIDDSDGPTANPLVVFPAVRPEEYPNIAFVNGEAFLSEDLQHTIVDIPAAAMARYDIVYIYVSSTGSASGIAGGAAESTATITAQSTAAYQDTYDPTIPNGSMAIGRIYVTEAGVQDVHDLRIMAP